MEPGFELLTLVLSSCCKRACALDQPSGASGRQYGKVLDGRGPGFPRKIGGLARQLARQPHAQQCPPIASLCDVINTTTTTSIGQRRRGADVEITCMIRNQYCNGERYTVRIDGQARQREGEGGREGGSYTRDLVTGIGGLARQLAGDHYVPPSQTRTEVRGTLYAPHAQTVAGPAFVGGVRATDRICQCVSGRSCFLALRCGLSALGSVTLTVAVLVCSSQDHTCDLDVCASA